MKSSPSHLPPPTGVSTFTISARLLGFGLLLLAGPAFSADKEPEIKVTTTPARGGSGPVVKIEGRFGSKYSAYEVADNTTFDLNGMVCVSRPTHPTAWLFVVGDQPVPPKNIRMIGGVFHGAIPLEWSWELTHAFSGAAFLTIGSGQHIVEHARIHNVQDGWRPRETQPGLRRAYPNNGSFLMRHCYVTGIRDDVIENDEFMPGAVEDSLFDGVWTFLSEQNERVNGVRYLEQPTIGPDESPDIHLTRALIRLSITSGGDTGVGAWFKLHAYNSPQHRIVATDSVFATDLIPRGAGWKRLVFPKNMVFQGNNLLLWLGEPGTYGAPIPEGLTFMEGKAARDKWHQLRNEWLVRHGYEPRGPDDWDPMKAPVEAPKRKVAAASRR